MLNFIKKAGLLCCNHGHCWSAQYTCARHTSHNGFIDTVNVNGYLFKYLNGNAFVGWSFQDRGGEENVGWSYARGERGACAYVKILLIYAICKFREKKWMRHTHRIREKKQKATKCITNKNFHEKKPLEILRNTQKNTNSAVQKNQQYMT